MTTITVKGANFASGPIAHYSPPVLGSTLCAFVGDADENTYLRNFGSGADLVRVAGKPAQIDPAFRRFNYLNYLKSDAYRTENTTLLAVYRNPTPITSFALVISSERDHADGGRRGCGLTRTSGTEGMYMGVFGTNAVNQNSLVKVDLAPQVGPAFIAGTVFPHTSPGAKVQAFRKTPTEATTGIVSVADADHQPTADEASFPFCIGHNQRPGVPLGDIDIGFVAVFPRVLTADEIDVMYQSVKRRFTALGVSI